MVPAKWVYKNFSVVQLALDHLLALSLATSDIGKLQKAVIIHVVVNSLIFRSTTRLLGNTSHAAIDPRSR